MDDRLTRDLRDVLPATQASTWEYARQEKEPWIVPPDLQGSIPARLICQAELDQLHFAPEYANWEYWDAFHAAFPAANGYYSFARPAFSHDGTESIVTWTWNCGPLCMNWCAARLLLREGGWQVVEWQLLGVS